MINRDSLYDALYEVVVSHNRIESQEEELSVFTFSMSRVPSGVSNDPAVIAEFESLVPETISSVHEALQYAALFLQKELVDFWRSPISQVLVDALTHAVEAGSHETLPKQFDGFLARLKSANQP